MSELSKKQLVRQDFVDNQIFSLINSLVPQNKKIEWDIEIIGTIRKALIKEIVRERKIVSEKSFYPFVKC